MADVKISALPAASALTGTELVPIVQGGVTVQSTPAAFVSNGTLAVSGTNLSYTGTLTGGTGVVNIGSGQLVKNASGNVGIGTSLPTQKIEVSGNSGLATGTGSPIAIRISDTSQDVGANTWNTTTDFTQLQFYSADASTPGGANIRYTVGAVMESVSGNATALTFRSSSSGALTERMRLDSSGNLGLGVTPSAWGSFVPKAIELPKGVALASQTNANAAHLVANAFYDGTWKYKEAAAASSFVTNNTGVAGFAWFTAPSGTAGNAISFTQAMTLDSSGNLGIGTTSATARISSSGTNTGATFVAAAFANEGLTAGSTVRINFLSGEDGTVGRTRAIIEAVSPAANNGDLVFQTRLAGSVTEKMRLDASGNLITNVNAAAPSLSTNSTMSFELTSNTSLKVVVRGTDGVTRSVSLTLS